MGESLPWLLYGAYGYTGRLIAEEAVKRGLRPVLAGSVPGGDAPSPVPGAAGARVRVPSVSPGNQA